jgi:hypothetical protein
MATFAPTPSTSTLQIHICGGNRQSMPADLPVFVTITDGNQKRLVWGDHKASELRFSLPFYDNFGDNYAVVVSADGHEQAGFHPVKLSPRAPQTLDLMLLRKDADYNFAAARWKALQISQPRLIQLLSAGAADAAAARRRYMDLLENRKPVLACFFNIVTAMAQVYLPSGTPLDYFKELVWGNEMSQDRFFAYCDPRLVAQVRTAADQKQFAPEPGTAAFHPGATCSFKQVRFGEANIQLTFHEDDQRTIGGVACIKVEPDIDYYQDPGAHAILEVIPNSISKRPTDPRHVYILRWIAGRRAGLAEFDPPYTIV